MDLCLPTQLVSVAISRFGATYLVPHCAALLPSAQVTAKSSVSISVNVWASGGAVERVQQLQSKAAAHFLLIESTSTTAGVFDTSWTLQVRSVMLERVAQQLVARTLEVSVESARNWLSTRMRSRWASVTSRFPKPLRKLARFCAASMRASRESMLQAKLATLHNGASDWIDATVERAMASAASALLELPAGATELEMGNLVEQLALDTLNDAKTTGSFLLHCFA